MRRTALLAVAAALLAACAAPTPQPGDAIAPPAARSDATAPTGAPRLLVLISIDGLPRRLLEEARADLRPGGLKRLLEGGADFTDAHHGHAHTVTCPGHAAMLTGAHPHRTGIVGNEWREPETGAWTYCLSDESHAYIGHATGRLEGTSPRKLRVETVGDVLRQRHPSAKVVAVSGKDRGAIPLAGHRGVAYAYRHPSGRFASTTYYMREHPAWVEAFNAGRAPGPPAAMDVATVDFARAALAGEALGADDVPDILAVSLSGQDSVNHGHGPESPQAREHLLHVDAALESFLSHLDGVVGQGRYVVAFTSDHGFAPTPEFSAARGWGGGRVASRVLLQAARDAITRRWGPGAWVVGMSASAIVLNRRSAAERGVPIDAMAEEARNAVAALEPVAASYTRAELLSGSRAGEPHFEAMRRSFHPEVSGDVQVVLKPYWIFSARTTGTTHGAPHAHDSHVPLAFYGPPWIRPGAVAGRVHVVDLAPTLARLLGLPPPPASEGAPLPLP